MNSHHFDIHSIVKIALENAPTAITDFLSLQLGHFSVSESDSKPDTIDITLTKLSKEEPDFPGSSLWHSLYGFTVSEFEGNDAIYFQYKDSCDIIVSISDTIVIYYTERPGIQRKLYSVLLFCINLVLNRKWGCMLHGAVLEKDDCCVMLAGHRGSMKTILCLTMLKHGWNYLSDDKCLLANQAVHMFQPTIPVRLHHFEALPWLEDYTDNTLKKFSTLKKGCLNLATKVVPKRLLSPLNRYLNPSQLVSGDQLSSGAQIIQHEKLTDIVILNTGKALRSEKLTRTEFVTKFTLIQNMASIDYALVEAMLKLKSDRVIHNLEKLIEHNIDTENLYQLSFPEKSSIDQVYQELTKCLQQR